MTVTTRSVGGRAEHFGLSSDTKPNSDIGARFYETDTGEAYTYTGSDWFKADTDNPSGDASVTPAQSSWGVTDDGTVILVIRKDSAADLANGDGKKAPLQVDSAGQLRVNPGALSSSNDSVSAHLATDSVRSGTTALTPKFAAIAASTSGANTLVAAVTSKKIRVLSLCIVAGAAGNIYFTSAAAGAVIFGGSTNKIQLAANGGFVLPFSPVGHFETVAGELLNLNASSTGPFSGGLCYVEV